AKLHRSFKSSLVRNFVNEGTEPFELHKHLDRQDWEMFVETATSEQFKEKSEHFKNLHARITDNHRLGPEGYDGKEKGRWTKEDKAMEEVGVREPLETVSWAIRAIFKGQGWSNT